MTQKQFAEYFRIPYRTLEDWERGGRHIAEYLLRLMIYRLDLAKVYDDDRGGCSMLSRL